LRSPQKINAKTKCEKKDEEQEQEAISSITIYRRSTYDQLAEEWAKRYYLLDDGVPPCVRVFPVNLLLPGCSKVQKGGER